MGVSDGGPRKRTSSATGAAAAQAARAPPVLGAKLAALRRSTGSGAAGAQRRRLLIAGAVGSAVLVIIVVGVAAGVATRPRRNPVLSAAGVPLGSYPKAPHGARGTLDAAYCAKLPAGAAQHCSSYVAAGGSGRFTAAAQWQKLSSTSYDCSGVSADCLNEDLKVGAAGSSCVPLKDGTPCRGSAKCSRGLCGGSDAFKAEQAPAPEAAPSSIVASAPLPGDADGTVAAAAARPAPARPSSVPREPVPGWGTLVAAVDTGARGPRVPPTFLATSHEWDRIADYADNIEAFSNIFKEFGPSPILRMGGASQDFLTEVPKPETWQALVKLHRAFNARFIIGLPLWKPDSIHLARRMMELTEAHLPKEAVVGFELGNEPEFWPTSVGGYEPGSSQFVPGFDAYSRYFSRVATALNPCARDGPKPKLAGPGWGNVNTIDAAWLATQAKAPGMRCYMRELSVHYYPYVNNDTIDARGLLDQGLQDFGVGKFNWLGGVAKAVQLPLRISETNSLYGGGRSGLSDTVTGTMWCADALFAFANAGAVGFHFHWGFGGRPIHGGQPNTGVQTNFENITTRVPSGEVGGPYPSVHAPWYGYLLFRHATAGADGGFSDTTLMRADVHRAGCDANVKVWPLLADGGALRVAVLNKDVHVPCNVMVSVEPQFCGAAGALHRLLPGRRGMMSKDGITWRGQSYEGRADGRIAGPLQVDVVRPRPDGGRCVVSVPMPAASGAVLELAP